MTYPETIEYLYNLRWFGTKLGLANTLKLAALAGNPQEKLRFIHVAGTNGKGSTCAMLESIYRAAGLRVGLFTSPHLVMFGERMQVDRRLISQDDVVRLVGEFKPLLKQFPGEEHPTFFEVVTVMALQYFAERECDLVIWETGMGGRLDATNIVMPLASLITNIQYDHQAWLGKTLAEIAGEKAGIIKPGVPIITATGESEALEVIAGTARERNAPLTHVLPIHTQQPPLQTLDLPLPGEHQKLNAALAVATVRLLQDKIPVTADQVRSGLLNLHWPGRLQLVTRPSGQKVLLDAAHNPAGAETLATAFRSLFPSIKPALILGILRDKDWREMCRILSPMARRIFLARVSSERSAAPEELQLASQQANQNAEITACNSLAEALEAAASEPFVIITGSSYLVGEALEALESTPAHPSERLLNEWGPR